jgi:predicted CopG family antitoxin
MGTKTIGLREEVYERLKARKREGESFTDLMDRLLDETTIDWREGFGTLSKGEGEELECVAEATRERSAAALSTRQRETLEALAEADEDDEAA